jgi:hypothetical protein
VTSYTGTINPLTAAMSGTWTDNYPPPSGSRHGTWATTSGAATQVVIGCGGKGSAHVSYADGKSYDASIQYVNVDGADAWFAGVVTSSTFGVNGNWVLVRVHDGGEPGIGVDQVWMSWSPSEAVAKWDVAMKNTPADGPFAATGGNVQVH